MVVVTGDRDVLGDAQAARPEDAIDLERHLVVATAEDSRRVGQREHAVDGVPEKLGFAFGTFEFAGRDKGGVEGQPDLGQRGTIPVAAQDSGGKRAKEREIADAPVPRSGETAGEVEHATAVVGQDRGRPGLSKQLARTSGVPAGIGGRRTS